METATGNPAAAAVGGRRELGEVRRLHIIYFLSRMGHIEHPHLIRVHHLNRNGVFLRDVKRWMGELRGQDMPHSFSWSYKRRYKTGYVWQDLMDEDLITPISDSEYVLKGSSETSKGTSTSRTPSPSSSLSLTSSSSPSSFEQASILRNDEDEGKSSNHNHSSPSTKLASSNTFYQHQSPVLSSSSDGQFKKPKPGPINKQQAPDQDHLTTNQMISPSAPATYASTLSSPYPFRRQKLESTQYINNVGLQKTTISYDPTSNASSSTSHPLQSPLRPRRSRRSQQQSASRMLRKLITCGIVDTNDNALVVLNRSSSRTLSSPQSSTPNTTKQGETQSISSATNHKLVTAAETELHLKLHNCNQQHDTRSARGDYEGIKGSTKTQPPQQARFCRETDVCAAYRPVGAPTCMQCGKSFRPEKLHLHMTKSCKGTRLTKKYDASPESPDNITQPCELLGNAATSSLPEVFV